MNDEKLDLTTLTADEADQLAAAANAALDAAEKRVLEARKSSQPADQATLRASFEREAAAILRHPRGALAEYDERAQVFSVNTRGATAASVSSQLQALRAKYRALGLLNVE